MRIVVQSKEFGPWIGSEDGHQFSFPTCLVTTLNLISTFQMSSLSLGGIKSMQIVVLQSDSNYKLSLVFDLSELSKWAILREVELGV